MKSRPLRGVLLFLFFYGCYVLVKNITPYSIISVSMTLIDEWVSLNPHWIWPYLSAYPMLAFLYLNSKNETHQRFIEQGFIFQTILCCICYFFYPFEVIRDTSSIEEIDNLSTYALSILYKVDTKGNCLPSTHVCMTLFLAMTYKKYSNKECLTYILGAFVVFYSTLATKQHMFYDMITGVILALITYWIFRPKEKNENI